MLLLNFTYLAVIEYAIYRLYAYMHIGDYQKSDFWGQRRLDMGFILLE